METDFEGYLLKDSVAKFEARLNDCLVKLPDGADRPKAGPLTKKYMSNRDHAVAGDAALRSVTNTSGVSHFLSPRLVGRLLPHEERYTIPLTDLPDGLSDLSVGLRKRSCIFNSETGETRLEVDWGTPMPSLWMCSDMGSDTWQHKLKYYYKFLVRGSEKHDPPHRTVRNRELALSQARGTFIKVEYGTVFSFVRGPWTCQGNLQLIKTAKIEYFGNFDENNVLFGLLYERISKAKISASSHASLALLNTNG